MSSFKKFLTELDAPKVSVPKNEHKAVDALIALFTKTSPSDEQVHQLAKKHGLEPSKAEEIAYDMLHSFLAKFGKHNSVPDGKFDPKEFKMGLRVEHEHTNDPKIAELVVKDHLSELSDYYSRLEKMEDEGKKKEIDKD